MHKAGKGYSVPNWSAEKAEEVIKAWQRKFTKVNRFFQKLIYPLFLEASLD